MARQKATAGERERLAALIRQAAADAGLDSPQIARQLGMSPQGVRAWWNGETVPSALQLAKLAALLGKPAAYFYDELLGWHAQDAWLRARFLAMCDQLMAGQSADRAWQIAQGDWGFLTPEDRVIIAEHGPSLRAALATRSGRPWSQLTRAEQLAIVDALLQAAEGAAPAPAPPAPRRDEPPSGSGSAGHDPPEPGSGSGSRRPSRAPAGPRSGAGAAPVGKARAG